MAVNDACEYLDNGGEVAVSISCFSQLAVNHSSQCPCYSSH